mmetsp:Transcript_102053/g.173045  ORF Transcript_102053/g.173045 Transcript_102053/m.173045 type:complete len:120 (+) Transcript_102053:600-959(+)
MYQSDVICPNTILIALNGEVRNGVVDRPALQAMDCPLPCLFCTRCCTVAHKAGRCLNVSEQSSVSILLEDKTVMQPSNGILGSLCFPFSDTLNQPHHRKRLGMKLHEFNETLLVMESLG